MMATLDQMWDDMVAHCEELEAEVERLRAYLQDAREANDEQRAEVERLQDARFMLETEVERLRGEKKLLLEQVSRQTLVEGDLRAALERVAFYGGVYTCKQRRAIARAALAKKTLTTGTSTSVTLTVQSTAALAKEDS